MSVWKLLVSTVAGDHVHCVLFVANGPNQTFANCGDFVVRRGEEFKSLKAAFPGAIYHGPVDKAEKEA